MLKLLCGTLVLPQSYSCQNQCSLGKRCKQKQKQNFFYHLAQWFLVYFISKMHKTSIELNVSSKVWKLTTLKHTVMFLYYLHKKLKSQSLESCERNPKGLSCNIDCHPYIALSIAAQRIWATVTGRHPLPGIRNSWLFKKSFIQMCGPYWLVKIFIHRLWLPIKMKSPSKILV